jgi:predicted component of type VI protein secretion system
MKHINKTNKGVLMRYLLLIGLLSVFTVACSSSDKTVLGPKDEAKEQQVQLEKKAEEKAASNAESLKCSLKNDVRMVEISKDSGEKLCEVHYTKSGDKERIASAERQKTYCDGVISKVKNNLESAGFNCSL